MNLIWGYLVVKVVLVDFGWIWCGFGFCDGGFESRVEC